MIATILTALLASGPAMPADQAAVLPITIEVTSQPPLVLPRPAPTAVRPANAAQRYCVVDTVTGSRVPRRICRTRGDWLQQGFDPLKA